MQNNRNQSTCKAIKCINSELLIYSCISDDLCLFFRHVFGEFDQQRRGYDKTCCSQDITCHLSYTPV